MNTRRVFSARSAIAATAICLPFLFGLGCDRIDATRSGDVTVASPRGTTFPTEIVKRFTSNVYNEECPEVSFTDWPALLEMREEHRFAELDEKMTSYREGFRKNALCEEVLRRSIESVSEKDATSLSDLREWVDHSATPESHIALANGLVGAGYEARGSKYSSETSKQRMSSMAELMNQAVVEAGRAIELDPSHPIAYGVLAYALKARGGCDLAKAALDRLLEQDPRSFYARRKTIEACQPKWGGNYETIERIASEAQAFAEMNRRLPVLQGFAHVYRGETEWRKKGDAHYRAALVHFDRAIEHGEYRDAWTSQRTRLYSKLKDWPGVVYEASHGIELISWNSSAWYNRADAYNKLEQFPSAIADFTRVIELKPDYRWGYTGRGWAYERTRNLEAAADDYARALEIDPSSRWTIIRYSEVVLEKLQKPERAIAEIALLVGRPSTNPLLWFSLGTAQQAAGVSGTADSFQRFLALGGDKLNTSEQPYRVASSYLRENGNGSGRSTRAKASLPGLSLLDETGTR